MKKEINTLTDIIKTEISNACESLFNGIIDEVSIDGITPYDLQNILENIGAESFSNIELNGWQSDYWLNFRYDNKLYTINGCGYYGTATIELYED